MLATATSTYRGAPLVAQFVLREGRKGPLVTSPDTAFIRFTVEGMQLPMPLDTPDVALRLLADKRLEPLWAPIAAFGGPGLVTLRDRAVEQARLEYEGGGTLRADTTSQSTVRPHVRALLRYSRALVQAGRGPEGRKLLEDWLAINPLKRGRNDWASIEFFAVNGELNLFDRRAGRRDLAVDRSLMVEQLLARSSYGLNATVNRAADLANMGRYADALTTIDGALQLFIKEQRGDIVQGSDRQFAWIRACALDGLGRKDEAREVARRVNRDAPDPDFITDSGNLVEYRLASCLRDIGGVAAVLQRDLEEMPVSGALVLLQPGRRYRMDEGRVLPGVLGDPGIRLAMAARMRVLPAEYDDALNWWTAK